MMHYESELCHIESARSVVRVSVWEGNTSLGSCLAEDKTVELAEQKAIQKINKRLNIAQTMGVSQSSVIKDTDKTAYKEKVAEKTSIKSEKSYANKKAIEIDKVSSIETPEDWSEDLAKIEFELDRLGWDRNKENEYLKKEFGVSSRSRMTVYSDLVSYLNNLKNIGNTDKSPQGRSEETREALITKSDSLISRLSWNESQCKSFLLNHKKVESRQNLSDEELIEFNQVLIQELDKKEIKL